MNEHQRASRDIQASPTTMPKIRQAGPTPVKALVATLSALTLVFSGVGYASVGRLGNQVASAGNIGLDDNNKEQPRDGATDILLVGSDSRTDAMGNPLSDEELERLRAGVDGGEENTDTLMVIRVPNDGSSATAVSIPRDTYIHDDDFGNTKINGVYAAHKQAKVEDQEAAGKDTSSKEAEKEAVQAGRAGLLNAVRELTGIEIDHYAEVGLFGFVLLTDAVGGVDVCLNDEVDDEFSGAKFPAGRQTLDGTQALAFVRQRHGLPRGDLDRIVRQQSFMASLVSKVLEAGTLTNPSTLNDMSKAVERSVVIDEDWDILSFANQLANLAGGNVTFSTIPVTSIDGTGDFGESVVTVNPADVNDFMDNLLNPPEDKDSTDDADAAGGDGDASDSDADAQDDAGDDAAADIDATIEVLNAGTTPGLAGSVAGELEDKQLTVGSVSNAEEGLYSESQIVAADPEDPNAKAVADLLGGLPVVGNESLDPGTVIVVVHDDYSGPLGEVTGDPSGSPTESVGTPGADEGHAEVSPEIDAGGDGPRCVN